MDPNSTQEELNQRSPWSAAEDRKLYDLVLKSGARRWDEVAKNFSLRNGKQCRNRWLNHVNPDVKKGAWAPEEDNLIISKVQQIGAKWSVIAKELPGRTDSAIKNRYYSFVRHKVAPRPESWISTGLVLVTGLNDTTDSTFTNESKRDDNPTKSSISSSSSSPNTLTHDALVVRSSVSPSTISSPLSTFASTDQSHEAMKPKVSAENAIMTSDGGNFGEAIISRGTKRETNKLSNIDQQTTKRRKSKAADVSVTSDLTTTTATTDSTIISGHHHQQQQTSRLSPSQIPQTPNHYHLGQLCPSQCLYPLALSPPETSSNQIHSLRAQDLLCGYDNTNDTVTKQQPCPISNNIPTINNDNNDTHKTSSSLAIQFLVNPCDQPVEIDNNNPNNLLGFAKMFYGKHNKQQQQQHQQHQQQQSNLVGLSPRVHQHLC